MVDAVVPGTAFTSYVTAGLEKDPNFGDNIHNVDRAKYDRSFWYRTEFKVPADFDKALTWLNFNGVNRKAEIYLNGHLLGILDGFMHRGRFNITEIVKKDQPNVLAVLVHMPQHRWQTTAVLLTCQWWLGLDALCAGTEYGYHG